MSKKICRYILEMRRSSNIEGVFIITDEELDAVKEMKGFEVRYGEIAGKHSEVIAILDIKDIEILSDKEEEVAFFERILPQGAGFCFKSYWFCTDEAYEHGYECGESKSYKDVDQGLEEYKQYNNKVMKEAFVEGFEEGRKNDPV